MSTAGSSTGNISLSRQEVAAIAKLAGLHLEAAELDRLRQHLSVILEYFRSLQSLDTEGVAAEQPFYTVSAPDLRDDQPTDGLSRTQVLSNAARSDGEFVVAPPVFADR